MLTIAVITRATAAVSCLKTELVGKLWGLGLGEEPCTEVVIVEFDQRGQTWLVLG